MPALLSLVGAIPASAGIRALLVGVGEYPSKSSSVPPLQAPPSDLKLMRQMLVDHFGAEPGMIVTLLDRQATSRAIQETFRRHLVDECRKEDIVVFYFTGHGVKLPDGWPDLGDEKDGVDEALAAYDYDESKSESWLNDDMIHHLLKSVPARHVLILFDSCFSGTGTRGTRGISPPFAWKTLSRSAEGENSLREANGPRHHLFFSACKDHEKANEIHDEARDIAAGAFTMSFARHVADGSAERPIGEFLTLLQRSVEEEVSARFDGNVGSRKQTPQLESARSDFSLSDFFKGQVYASDDALDTTPPPPPPSPATPFVVEGELKVTLATNKPAYVWTDNLTATATVNRPAYLRIVHVDSEGTQTQFFPNKRQPQRLIQPGEVVELPAPGRAIRITNTTPPGLEMLIATASTKPFTDADIVQFSDATYNAIAPGPIAKTLSRGIEVAARPNTEGSTASPAPASGSPAAFGQAVTIFRVSEFAR